MDGAEKLAKPSGWRKYRHCGRLWYHEMPDVVVRLRKTNGRWSWSQQRPSDQMFVYEEIPDVKTFVEAIQVVSVILRMM